MEATHLAIKFEGGMVVMSKEVAYCLGVDYANRQMRAADRKKWSAEDYNLAVETQNRFWPLCCEFPFIDPSMCGCKNCQTKIVAAA
jgi:hypothetical protein